MEGGFSARPGDILPADKKEAVLTGRLQPIRLGEGKIFGDENRIFDGHGIVVLEGAIEDGVRGDTWNAEAVKRHRLVGPIDERRFDLDLVSRSGGIIAGDGLHPEPGAGLDDPQQFVFLYADPRLLPELGQFRINAQQAGDRFRRMFGIERLQDLGQKKPDGLSSGDAIPGDVDPVENVRRRRVSVHELEGIGLSSPPPGRAESLALVLGPALSGHFRVGFSQPGIVAARVDPQLDLGLRLRGTEGVPEQPLGLPDRYVFQLFGKSLRLGGRDKRFLGQQSGGDMVAVSAGVLRRKTGEDHVGLESPDHPDDIAEDFFLSPEFKGLLGRLGIAEIDGPGKKLFGPVDPAGRHELLRPEETDLGAFLRADQILAAFAAGDGKIGRPHVPSLREIGQDGGIFIVRMGSDEKGASENVELAKGDFQFPGMGDLSLLGSDRQMEQQTQPKDKHDELLHVQFTLRPKEVRFPKSDPRNKPVDY